jgi:membrane protease YdiL (CAAX protease family)
VPLAFRFLIVSLITYGLFHSVTKTNMTSLATEELLLRERSGQISSETGGGSSVIQYADATGTALRRIGDVLPGRTNGEPAETFQPIASKTAEGSTASESIRGRDLLLIALYAYLGWATFWFVCGLVAGLFYFAMGYGTDPDAFAAAASQNFYLMGIVIASFYFAALLAMQRRLRKRRGRGSFAGYFGPIGVRRLTYAALSGLLAFVLVFLMLSVIRSLVHPQYHSAIAKAIVRPHWLGRLAVSGLICIVLAPFTEEMFFRGLLLEWLQPKLGRLPAALTTATIFALYHLRFLEYPGMDGWIATVLIAAMGLLCALWAQRTRSLRAPVAVHAAYNAMFVFVTFLGH